MKYYITMFKFILFSTIAVYVEDRIWKVLLGVFFWSFKGEPWCENNFFFGAKISKNSIFFSYQNASTKINVSRKKLCKRSKCSNFHAWLALNSDYIECTYMPFNPDYVYCVWCRLKNVKKLMKIEMRRNTSRASKDAKWNGNTARFIKTFRNQFTNALDLGFMDWTIFCDGFHPLCI